jgi:heme/copper-type cytochrome/quinol oxidase subunit 3
MTDQSRIVGSVADLPSYAFGPRSLMWWGTVGFMLIEGTGFAIAAGAYFYLMGQVPRWPPEGRAPDLLWGTLTAVVLVLSAVPNVWLNRVARAQSLGPTRAGLVLMGVLGLIPLVLRGFEFTALNVRWDLNAYGSIIWALVLLHTLHIATDVYDTLVLAVVVFTNQVDGRRYSDVTDNAMYWHFVWLTWLPIYVLIYWVPRMGLK